MGLGWVRSSGITAIVLACAVGSAACAVSQAGAATGHSAARHQASQAKQLAATGQHTDASKAGRAATTKGGATKGGATKARHASAARSSNRAATRPGVVLVNQPVAKVCVSKKFRVGVWFQRSGAGGSRAYRISVYTPQHKRIFFRRGQAPTAHWAFWKIPAKMAGAYHTVYSAHWRKATAWTRYRVATTARTC